jgi:hypothetical protein
MQITTVEIKSFEHSMIRDEIITHHSPVKRVFKHTLAYASENHLSAKHGSYIAIIQDNNMILNFSLDLRLNSKIIEKTT